MPIDFENGRADGLACELAALTGESVADAVTKALAECVEREKAARSRLSKEEIEKRMAAAHEIRALGRRLREEGATSDHDWLYDPSGLSRDERSAAAPQINIKDPETNEMIDELARLTGRSKTEVVRHSVRTQLDGLKSRQRDEFERTMKDIRVLQERARALMKEGETFSEDDLYDENGLPK